MTFIRGNLNLQKEQNQNIINVENVNNGQIPAQVRQAPKEQRQLSTRIKAQFTGAAIYKEKYTIKERQKLIETEGSELYKKEMAAQKIEREKNTVENRCNVPNK